VSTFDAPRTLVFRSKSPSPSVTQEFFSTRCRDLRPTLVPFFVLELPRTRFVARFSRNYFSPFAFCILLWYAACFPLSPDIVFPEHPTLGLSHLLFFATALGIPSDTLLSPESVFNRLPLWKMGTPDILTLSRYNTCPPLPRGKEMVISATAVFFPA